MRFHVQGTDARSGQPVSTFFEAPTKESAEEMATEQGIIIQLISEASISGVPVTSTPFSSSGDGNVFTESLTNTWAAWKILVRNPIDGIGIASEALGERGRLQAGIVSGIFYVLSQVFFLSRILSIFGSLFNPFLGAFSGLPGIDSASSGFIDLSFYVKVIIIAAIPIATLVLALFLSRNISKTPASIHTDIFGAGISALPLTLVYTVVAVLTPNSFEFTFVLFLWAVCVSILMTYHCFTNLSKLPSRLAVYAVPVTILVNSIFTRIVGDILF
jgi:hypothetical protein